MIIVGCGLMSDGAAAQIRVVIAGISGVMLRIRSVISARIHRSTGPDGRHRARAPELARPSGGSHARHAMIDGSKL